MNKFTLQENSFLGKCTQGYYSKDYIGYQQPNNPDFINHLKNMTKAKNELELVHDFVVAYETAYTAIKEIIQSESLLNCVITVVPRSKTENSYAQSQKMFRKAISCVADQLKLTNATEAFKRVKNTRTTHSWRMENNTGDLPYPGITRDTCEIDGSYFHRKDVILVDDIYTKNINVAEDCIQTLYDFGAKRVIMYVIAKTRE